MLHWSRIDTLRHAVKVDKKAEEDLVCRWTVLVNPTQIAQDGDAGNILAMESQHTCSLLAES
jgi:hypothetical protein